MENPREDVEEAMDDGVAVEVPAVDAVVEVGVVSAPSEVGVAKADMVTNRSFEATRTANFANFKTHDRT